MLIISVYTDVKFEKVYNGVLAIGFLVVILKLVLNFSWKLLFFTVGGILFPIVSLFPLFYFRMMGAGDIKLLSMAGGFLEFRGAVICLIISIFIGALIALYKMCRYHLFHERFAYFSYYMKKYLKTKDVVPYYEGDMNKNAKFPFAFAIAVAVVLYLVLF